ncbi:hypothetical protein QDY72_05915, partial [Kingella negevensis]|uniref:hypothetical protein n=1 Tax=Kingella negevensis TaxID=1522312 RepID=UPI00254AA176
RVLLTEKGLKCTSQTGLNHIAQISQISSIKLKSWVFAERLPHKQSLKELAQWLDCNESDLIPPKYANFINNRGIRKCND